MAEVMKVFKVRHFFLIIFVALCFFHGLGGCRRIVNQDPGGNVTSLSPQLQGIFDKTKVVCFGRFLMSVPEETIIVYGPAQVESTIMYQEGAAKKVSELISSKIMEVEEERQFLDKSDLKNLPLFGKVIEGGRPEQKIVVGSKDQIGYELFSLVPIQENLFIQTLDGGLPEYNFIERINNVAKSIRLRKNEEIPSEPGMCIDGGFVSGTYEYEQATVGIRFNQFPDVHLSIDAHKNLEFVNEDANPKTLHERARKKAEAMGLSAVFSKGKILREQVRQIGHWTGQEMAFRTPAYKHAESVHEFRFYSVGLANDPFHPQLDIRLDSGVKDDVKGAIRPSITDDEALALWDKVIKTIRLREPGDATPAKIDKVSLGTQVRAGKTCPQAGWWKATDKHLVSDDRRQFLQAGDAMPYTFTSRGAGVWTKIFGGSRVQTATAWTLVAYEDKPAQAALDTSITDLYENTDGAREKHA